MVKKDNPSKVQTIRLRAAHWAKLRALMRYYGNRHWLEIAIDRKYKAVSAALEKERS